MKMMYRVMQFSRFSASSVIFHQVFSSGTNIFSSEKKRRLACLNTKNLICSHLAVDMQQRCKLKVLNFEEKMLSFFSFYYYKYYSFASS